jgi:hypothetical protein
MKKNGRVTEEQPAPTGTIAWVGFGCCVFALACLCISFCSPYWIQTWPMSENRFKNMGLWHVCFYNYMQFKDDSQQIYSECWWVFDQQTRHYKLREWLIPPWFISCQVLTTGCLVIEIATAIVTGLIFLHCCPLMNHEYLQTYGIFAAGSMMFLVTMVSLVVAILFGWQVNDRYWMPRPDQNYLSWGFGFLIISAICTLVAGLCLFKAAWDTYQELLRREDEYTRQALELSTFQMMDQVPTDQDFSVVQPGYSGIQPGYYEGEQPSFGPPTYGGRPPSYTARPSETREPADFDKSWEKKPLTEPSFERRPQAEPSWERQPQPAPAAAAATYEAEPTVFPLTDDVDRQREPAGAYGGRSFDQRESGVFGKSYDQPTAYGKSYDKSYERHHSDTSFDDAEQELYPPRPERQY